MGYSQYSISKRDSVQQQEDSRFKLLAAGATNAALASQRRQSGMGLEEVLGFSDNEGGDEKLRMQSQGAVKRFKQNPE